MILFDISAIMHISAHHLASKYKQNNYFDIKEHKTEFFKGILFLMDRFLSHPNFMDQNNIVLCLDNKDSSYWRKDLFAQYKSNRKAIRDSVSFSFTDVYSMFDEFLEAFRLNSGFKVLSVPKCEGDDLILVLGEHGIQSGEEVLIVSPDKDFIQLQYSTLVKQYNPRTFKPVLIEDKSESLEGWLLEHVCLGDLVDGVPRIVDFREFNDGVEDYLKSKGINLSPLEFSRTSYDNEEFESKFGGAFKKQPFGPATLKKLLAKNDLNELLASDNVLKENYELNRKLVLLEGIPKDIKEKILEAYNEKPLEFNSEKLAKALGLSISELPEKLRTFKNTFSFDDF